MPVYILEEGGTLLTTLAICTCLLFLKHVWTIAMQGGAAIKAATRIPEDFDKLGLPRPLEVSEQAKANDHRWRRLVANDLENVLFGLIVFWSCGLAIAAAGSKSAETVLVILVSVFTASRYAYTACFIYALQPWRTVFWGMALLCAITASILGTATAFYAQYHKG